MENTSVTFLLADDHSLIRQGIEFLVEELGFDGDIFHANTLKKVLDTLENQDHIDIVIIDAIFPDGNSLTIIPEIRTMKPNVKILVFSGVDENTQSVKYINAGANGFLTKLSEEEDIKNAILKIHQHGSYLSTITQGLLMDNVRKRKSDNSLQSLTGKEMEIAKMLAQGLGNLEIANNLNVKQNTISTVKKRILDKLNIQNIVELIDILNSHH